MCSEGIEIISNGFKSWHTKDMIGREIAVEIHGRSTVDDINLPLEQRTSNDAINAIRKRHYEDRSR